MSNYIIGISGISGAGKTTLTTELAKALKATAIFWDDYDEISKSPADYVAWYHSKQGNEAWDYPALATTLETLKAGESILHPALHCSLAPSSNIIFDAPMGRLHQQTGQYIDYWVHIDIPLDIALARRTIRDAKQSAFSTSQILDELQYYIEASRPLYFTEDEMKEADLIIDGTLSIKEQIVQIQKYLAHKHQT